MKIVHPILLFDGVCSFCNATVQFSLKHDKTSQLRFAALQSEIGQELLKKHGLSVDNIDTVVLIENDKAYIKSSAALHLVRYFGGFWQLLYGFIIVPAFLRNAVYDIVAKNRYKWFGKQDACMLPSSEERARFLS